jgi:hypothetical protein
MIEDRMRAHDEQFSQISIAHFRDAAQTLLTSGRVLSRRQAKKGGELARPRERETSCARLDHLQEPCPSGLCRTRLSMLAISEYPISWLDPRTEALLFHVLDAWHRAIVGPRGTVTRRYDIKCSKTPLSAARWQAHPKCPFRQIGLRELAAHRVMSSLLGAFGRRLCARSRCRPPADPQDRVAQPAPGLRLGPSKCARMRPCRPQIARLRRGESQPFAQSV